MTRRNEGTVPVAVLREHATALEAALSVCLADPGVKPVHRLRPETRRVEAQLLLLAAMPEMPEHRSASERLRRALRRLRQAAGEVRDLDVQRKRLEEIAEAAKEAAGQTAGNEAGQAAGQAEPNGGEEAGTAEEAVAGAADGAAMQAGAASVREELKGKREAAAESLQHVLRKRQVKTAGAAETLLKVLEPGAGAVLPAAELLRHAEALLWRDGLLGGGDVSGLDEDELHTVRKAAKAARYLAETMPESGAGSAEAQRFEALQEAGGQWHDALDLLRVAKQLLGKGHALTAAMGAERDRHVQEYREALGGLVQAGVVKAAERAPGRGKAKGRGGKRSAGRA